MACTGRIAVYRPAFSPRLVLAVLRMTHAWQPLYNDKPVLPLLLAGQWCLQNNRLARCQVIFCPDQEF